MASIIRDSDSVEVATAVTVLRQVNGDVHVPNAGMVIHQPLVEMERYRIRCGRAICRRRYVGEPPDGAFRLFTNA